MSNSMVSLEWIRAKLGRQTVLGISVLHSELRLELRSFGSKVLSHANHIMVFSLPAWFR